MTTFSELKVALARDLRDPANKTFTDAMLGDLINGGIMEVSRVAPQRFREDIDFITSEARYQVRGGTGNLVANWSFEGAGEDVIHLVTAELDETDAGASTGGWLVSPGSSPTMDVLFPPVSASMRKTGTHIGRTTQYTSEVGGFLYQDIPVNPGSVYVFSGWHWKASTGGVVSALRGKSLDDELVEVDAALFSHYTTAGDPQFYTTSITVPDDGSVSYIRIELAQAGTAGATQYFYWEDISLVEQSEVTLVSVSARASIEVTRVEIWDESDVPERFVTMIEPITQGNEYNSQQGWELLDGYIYIPDHYMLGMTQGTHMLRVTGYAPYDKLSDDDQVTDLSTELEYAVLKYGVAEGHNRLVSDRNLFTQWQTRSNNSDVSPASLMGSVRDAREDWRRTKREITVLRER